jgi:hypothetical protein
VYDIDSRTLKVVFFAVCLETETVFKALKCHLPPEQRPEQAEFDRKLPPKPRPALALLCYIAGPLQDEKRITIDDGTNA